MNSIRSAGSLSFNWQENSARIRPRIIILFLTIFHTFLVIDWLVYHYICAMTLNISQAHDLLDIHHKKNIIDSAPAELYEPRNYIMSLGGKRLRSVLCLLGYSLYQDDLAQASDLAYAIELFHNFTLVHDDIMDDADLRRGSAAVHKKYDENTAILSGDVMLVEVYDRLTSLGAPNTLEIIRFFTQTAREVCEGQSYDMTFETSDTVEIEDYLKMIELKTAVLLGGALKLGAMLAQAPADDLYHLYNFGLNAGISFQLQDDYLDVYGDPSAFGKKVGGDIIQGKKTYLYLRALNLLNANDRPHFIELYQNSDMESSEKVKRVRGVFDELYISNYCEEAKNSFFELAESHLKQVQIADEEKDNLREFARKLLDRSF